MCFASRSALPARLRRSIGRGTQRAGMGRMHDGDGEVVSDGPDGLDLVAQLGGVVELAAQAAYAHVEASVKGVGAAVGAQFGEMFAGEDLPRGAHQRCEQLKFDIGQVQLDVVAAGGSSAAIEFDSTYGEVPDRWPGRPVGRAAPQDGPDAGQQLARIEWLGKIVVGADLEADDAVDVFAARRQQQHADLGAGAQPAQNFESIEAGQHHIQKHNRKLAGQGAMQAKLAVVFRGNGESVTHEVVLKHRAKFDIVIDQKYRFHNNPL